MRRETHLRRDFHRRGERTETVVDVALSEDC